MKKLFLKLAFSITSVVIGVVALVILANLIWGYCVPTSYAAGDASMKEVQEYLVAQMPELEGADANAVSFDANGMYHVYYDGKTFIVNDTAVQNNIGVFIDKYEGFNYRSKIANRALYVSFIVFAVWGFSIAFAVLNIIERSRKIKEERKKIKQVAHAIA